MEKCERTGGSHTVPTSSRTSPYTISVPASFSCLATGCSGSLVASSACSTLLVPRPPKLNLGRSTYRSDIKRNTMRMLKAAWDPDG